MDKVHTSERLRKIMSDKNLKQVDIINLAKPLCDLYKVKLGRNDISQYVSGKVEPRQNKLYILAQVLNVNEAWLMGYDVPKERTPEEYVSPFQYTDIKPVAKKRIPMLGKIACGEPIYCNEDYETYIEASSDITADFCLTAKGDSMINARIFDGASSMSIFTSNASPVFAYRSYI